MKLEGACAIVTGAAMGIGRGVALRVAREGASVVVADVNQSLGQRTVADIMSNGGQAIHVTADVSSEEDIAAMFDGAHQRFGPVKLLVNNAGGAGDNSFPFADSAAWRGVIERNLIGVMYGTQHAVRSMTESAGGAIVSISSIGGIGFRPYDLADYGAAKAGVIRMTSSLGTLSGTHGIRVNCICPGWVDTPASRRSRATMPVEDQPAACLTPDDIGEAVMHFVSNDDLAGRVMVWHEGQPWHLVPLDQEPLGATTSKSANDDISEGGSHEHR